MTLPVTVTGVSFDRYANASLMKARAAVAPCNGRGAAIVEWTVPNGLANQICDLVLASCPVERVHAPAED